MKELAISDSKVRIKESGIEFLHDLDRDEWLALGKRLARVGKSIGFIIGDWINYGEHKWGEMYAEAIAETGLDYGTLRNFAYVAGRVSLSLRNDKLDFAHHMVVAKLKSSEDQREWLTNAEKHRMSVTRLRKSVNMGRVVMPQEIEEDPADKGHVTYMVFINRLCQWFRRETDKVDMDEWDAERKRLLKRDLKPLVEIYEKL